MLNPKIKTLQPILESVNGVHLTIYLVNQGDLSNLKSQLTDSINQSYEWLNQCMSTDERNKFLEPLDSLLLDSKILNNINGHIGIFRNKEIFRVLSIPVDVVQTCHVATSFHVKPVLKWLQSDQDFLFLGLEKESANLYHGNNNSFRLLETIAFTESAYNNVITEKINTTVNKYVTKSKPKMFLAGDKNLIESLGLKVKYNNIIKTPVARSFSKDNAVEICFFIRNILKTDSKSLVKKTLAEFKFAGERNLVQKNIFQITKAVVQGQVRKLVVTDEVNIFGKIDTKSGGMSIHPYDLDHEDDDVLDDLAQMVLTQGGEVVVASRKEIPDGRPILAILDNNLKTIEKLKELEKHSKYNERTA